MAAVDQVVALSTLLFAVGVVGLLVRRNLIAQLLFAQLIVAASALALLGFARVRVATGVASASATDAQAFVLIALVLGLAEAVLALVLVIALVRGRQSLDLEDASLLRG